MDRDWKETKKDLGVGRGEYSEHIVYILETANQSTTMQLRFVMTNNRHH